MAAGLGRRLLDLVLDERSLQLAELSRAFNPFRVLRIETYELRHTNTLAWLLTPSGSHGLGSAFAIQFLKAVCDESCADGTEILTAIAQSDLDAIQVWREATIEQLKSIGKSAAEAAIDGTLEQVEDSAEDDDDRPGRLDVLVESETWLVAIEAKIRSKQASGQLPKYENALSIDGKGRRKLLVYLTNDTEESIPSTWASVSWKKVVADPLTKIVERLPDTRKTEPQIAFLRSFLEILGENSSPAEGLREDLLNGLVHDYGSLLNEIRVRKDAKTLAAPELELIHRNFELINALEKRYKPANEVRAVMLTELIENDGRFTFVKSERTYLRFIFQEWSSVSWMGLTESAGQNAAVLAEFVNSKEGYIQLKLQIRDLAGEDPHQIKRARLLQLIQADSRPEVRARFPKVFTSRGLSKPKDYFFSVRSTEKLFSPESDTREGAKSLLNGDFIESMKMMTEFIMRV